MAKRSRIDWDAPPLDSADQRLVDAYLSVRRPVDDLPYTREFEELYSATVPETADPMKARHDLFRRLLWLRKTARLPRIGRTAGVVSSAQPDSADQRLIDAYVTVGRPLDDLPYTEEFEALRRLIGAEDSDLARHFVLRRLLTLRKNGWLPGLGLSRD